MFISSIKQIRILLVAEPKILPDFFSRIPSIFFYKDIEVMDLSKNSDLKDYNLTKLSSYFEYLIKDKNNIGLTIINLEKTGITYEFVSQILFEK
jgi:hypothetical protein